VLPAAPLSRFDYLRRETMQESDSTLASDLMTELAAKTPEEAQEVIKEIVLHEAGKILSVSAERINPSLSIHDLGMDSLMLVELALAIEQRFGFKLVAMELKTAATSIESISKSLVKKLKEGNSTEADHLISLMETIETQHGSDISAQTITETMQEIRLKAT
jgi:acyl carrier protein